MDKAIWFFFTPWAKIRSWFRNDLLISWTCCILPAQKLLCQGNQSYTGNKISWQRTKTKAKKYLPTHLWEFKQICFVWFPTAERLLTFVSHCDMCVQQSLFFYLKWTLLWGTVSIFSLISVDFIFRGLIWR